MRVALVAESFLPHMNGVTNSVLHVLRQLAEAGHETLVIAPKYPDSENAPNAGHTELLRSVPLPSYPQVRIVFVRAARIATMLRSFKPDVVHLASPFVLGWQALMAAERLGIPTVAVYQTDVVAYAEKYKLPQATTILRNHMVRLHRRATLTLVPSGASKSQLEQLGIDRLRLWGRGVDADRFTPQRRSERVRARLGADRKIVGYVGRLAPEKQVEDLRVLSDLDGVQLVIVGDGPSRAYLEKSLPEARFLGHLSGDDLAETVAAFDVFVHTGESETFGQTIQEAMASGVPVVATGRGGPLDIVHSSVDGWLYQPGHLDQLRQRVLDLLGDEAKRKAFGRAAREGIRERTWASLVGTLMEYYTEAVALGVVDRALLARPDVRPSIHHVPEKESPRMRWSSFVALGDSITEGLCDSSRVEPGDFRGWADRLAMLLACAHRGSQPFRYANLAVRSRRVRDLENEQVDQAIALRPDLVAILMGANDLVSKGAEPTALAARMETQVKKLQDAGCMVLLVTPFLPHRHLMKFFARRFATFSSELRKIARRTGALLLDVDALPIMGDPEMWADDKVHLCSRGHRYLAYRAADVLGIPDAETLGELDDSLHDDETDSRGWVRRHALPWVWRRMRGRTAGDGMTAKHDGYVELPVAPQLAPPRVIDAKTTIHELR